MKNGLEGASLRVDAYIVILVDIFVCSFWGDLYMVDKYDVSFKEHVFVNHFGSLVLFVIVWVMALATDLFLMVLLIPVIALVLYLISYGMRKRRGW